MLISSYHNLLWWGDAWSKKLNTFNPEFGKKSNWRKYFYFHELAVMEVVFGYIFEIFEYRRYNIYAPKLFFIAITPILILLPTKLEIIFFRHKANQMKWHKKKLVCIIKYIERILRMQNAFFYNLFYRKSIIKINRII